MLDDISVTNEQLNTLRDLQLFASKFLIIRTKSGRPQPLTFNRAQQYLHRRLEDQLRVTGKVRAIILKGRQCGTSTYIQARYFHKVILKRGVRAFILTHELEATKNLFEMAKRFYDGLPKGLTYEVDRSSAKELRFNELDSGYSVGAAGNKAVGRSQTIQLFHGSEVGYWENAEDHARGVLQAVPSEPATEVIFESTANGIGNYFYNAWRQATTSSSEYQAIFLPWYWQTEYTRTDTGFKPSEHEQQLLDMYADEGLTLAHINWRRVKISELSHDEEYGNELFSQEYPMCAEEAFRNPIDNVFIDSKLVMRARLSEVESDTNLILGIDPAISGNDRTAVIRRKGRLAYNLEYWRNHNTMESVGRIRKIIDQELPVRVYIDCIGIGAGIVDRLREMGYTMVEGVNVARTANDRDRYKNLRAELWGELRLWLAQELPVQIPDSDELHGELCSLGFKYNSNGQLVLESKDDLRARGMPSCDLADALALSFYCGQYAGSYDQQVHTIPVAHRTMFY